MPRSSSARAAPHRRGKRPDGENDRKRSIAAELNVAGHRVQAAGWGQEHGQLCGDRGERFGERIVFGLGVPGHLVETDCVDQRREESGEREPQPGPAAKAEPKPMAVIDLNRR